MYTESTMSRTTGTNIRTSRGLKLWAWLLGSDKPAAIYSRLVPRGTHSLSGAEMMASLMPLWT